MSDQIMTRAQAHARGAAAFKAGHGRNDHHMNPGAPAVTDWKAGWDEAKAARTPHVQHARAGVSGADQRQGAVA